MQTLDDSVTQRRFGGLDRLYGRDAAHRIRRAHVAVVGVGGVGSWAAEALARSGVGQISLIDLDHVAESNVNRQVHATSATLGQAKVLAMQERIAQINPGCVVHCIDEFATPQNWPQLLVSDVDAVLDACDSMPTKVAIAAWAMQSPVAFVTVGAAGGKKAAQRVEIADLSQVTHDPLLAKLRYSLRRHHGARKDAKPMGVACVFSREAVLPPDASCDLQSDGSLNCHGYGSLVTVTSTFGMCAAGALMEKISKPRAFRHGNDAII